MRVTLALGSNLGDRKNNLALACKKLSEVIFNIQTSVNIETPALLPQGAPPSWDLAYLNSIITGETKLSPPQLLDFVKNVERILERKTENDRWSPRTIDIDIILAGDGEYQDKNLTIPHEAAHQRSFVLTPMVLMQPNERLGCETVLNWRRRISLESKRFAKPLVMGIVNITPDSFSDGGHKFSSADFANWWESLDEATLPEIFDLGAQSTRPGAELIAEAEELRRLKMGLEIMRSRPELLEGRWLSVDTFRPEIAEWAMAEGFQIINDVSGGADIEMIRLLSQPGSSKTKFVFMHNLGVPASRSAVLAEDVCPFEEILCWARQKVAHLLEAGMHREQLIFDPGVGFGKSALHSLDIMTGVSEFHELDLPLLVGHSRKSSLRFPGLSGRSPDGATLAFSLHLAQQGVEILRVHDFANHQSALFSNEWINLRYEN